MKVAGVLFVLLALAPASSLAAPNMRHGFSTGAISSLLDAGEFPDPNVFNPRALQVAEAAAGASADTMRIEVSWQRLQPSEDTPSWSLTGTLDTDRQFQMVHALYQRALERGVKPLLLVWRTPGWARDNAEDQVYCKAEWNCVLPPAESLTENRLPAWQAFVRRVVENFPEAAGVQVWNEPNNEAFWRSGPNGARYARVLRYAYQGVRQASATMPVSAFSVGVPDPAADPAIGWSYSQELRDYLTSAYQAGARSWYDKFAAHPYPMYPNAGSAPDGNSTFRRKYDLVQDIRHDRGDHTPLWITEWGYSTGSHARAVTEAQQARWTECGYRLALGLDEVEMFLIYELRDLAANQPAHPPSNFGVLYRDFSPKPVYGQLQDMFATGRALQPVTSCESVP